MEKGQFWCEIRRYLLQSEITRIIKHIHIKKTEALRSPITKVMNCQKNVQHSSILKTFILSNYEDVEIGSKILHYFMIFPTFLLWPSNIGNYFKVFCSFFFVCFLFIVIIHCSLFFFLFYFFSCSV
jgi:hypothetical protein